MVKIINITKAAINNEEVNAVNARDLWKQLGSRQEFANWIKGRISEYGFEEGRDFLTNLSKSFGRPSKEYIISLDMAKELAMVENNTKGREIRRYFIKVEKQLRNADTVAAALLERLERQLMAHTETIVRQRQELRFLRAFAPTGEPGEISRETGAPKYRFRRGYYTSDLKARPVKLLFRQPDLPGLTVEEAYLIEEPEREEAEVRA